MLIQHVIELRKPLKAKLTKMSETRPRRHKSKNNCTCLTDEVGLDVVHVTE